MGHTNRRRTIGVAIVAIRTIRSQRDIDDSRDRGNYLIGKSSTKQPAKPIQQLEGTRKRLFSTVSPLSRAGNVVEQRNEKREGKFKSISKLVGNTWSIVEYIDNRDRKETERGNVKKGTRPMRSIAINEIRRDT